MSASIIHILDKREVISWESTLPEFAEEAVNKRYRAELDFGAIDRT